MTRYTVVWDTDVEASLANAWIAGNSAMRFALTAIADWIDTSLSEDPDLKGQPLPEISVRTMNVPLSISTARVEVTYQVFPDDRLVRVVRIVFRSD
jgi:hypothetical protein